MQNEYEIYVGAYVRVHRVGTRFQLEIHGLESSPSRIIKSAYSEENLMKLLKHFYEIADQKEHDGVRIDLHRAMEALEEYWMYGSVGGHEAVWSDEAPSELEPEEAALRLENLIEKRPQCYGDHKCDGRQSRCLICEHETECIAATKKLAETKSTKCTKPINSTESRKENIFMKQMENLFKDFYPSEVPSGEVALTMAGQIAVGRKDGSYVRYDAKSGQIENQMNLVISSKKLDKMYLLMPTPINQLAAGDVIKEKDTYYQIIEVKAAEARIKAANLSTGTESNIKIENNIFTGQKMYRKVFSFFNAIQTTGNQNVAGMMNPMALMMLDSMGDSSDDAMKMFAMMSMMNPQAAGQGMNPMMMYFMMGDSNGADGDNWIKTMAMMSMMQQFGVGQNPFNFNQMMQAQAAQASAQNSDDQTGGDN